MTRATVDMLRLHATALLFPVFFASLATSLPCEAYQEAPMLAERVARGELPPVEQRLPENPAVVEPVESIGTYGGTWRRAALGGADTVLTTRMGYEPPLRWDKTARKVVPGLAERWEVLDEGRTYILYLRKGLRWSDGHPLTAEDFLFTFEDVLKNKELAPVFPAWLNIGGTPVRLSAPDPCTLVYEFAAPYGIFPQAMAFSGCVGILLPKHYMKQFHPKYAGLENVEKLARQEGLELWREIFANRANHVDNPDLPNWRPFILTVPPPALRIVAERNPYYWKVDPEGNQLPYIDRVVFTDVSNNEIITMKALNGELDFQARRIDFTNYSLFQENSDDAGYRVARDLDTSSITLYVNNYSKDPVMRPILQSRDFRIALSLAIDRDEINFLLFDGLGEPARGIACPQDPFYLPEFDEKYLEYDPEQANALLDAVGLTRGPNGMRRLPDGRPFREMINLYPSETGTPQELWQLVAAYYREVGLDFIVKMDARGLSTLQAHNGNYNFFGYRNGVMHWVVHPLWHVPWTGGSFYAPLYGRHVASSGRDVKSVKPSPEFQRLVDWYLELRSSVDKERRLEMGHNILGQWAEECYAVGICRPQVLTIINKRFRNVPDHIIHDYRIYTPGYIGIEQFYFEGGSNQ